MSKQSFTGSSQKSEELFDQAVRAFNVYRGDPVEFLDEALSHSPGFAMAHIFKAYLFGLATEPEATQEATKIVERAKALAMTDFEKSHIGALESLTSNNWTEAAKKLDLHNMSYPFDIIGLQAGHLIDFYRANARSLRDRIARVLPQWSENQPGYSILLGMYSFGLEESGDYQQAEATGKEATAREPLDCWAHHAVAHVLEMQGRAEEGIAWMKDREPHWSGDDNFFKVHNWWHKALYHLDLDQSDEAFALYDDRIRDGASNVALDLVDASALLWRMHLDGHDVGNRWNEIADAWDIHADGRLYPFNDWHAVMAYLGAGRSGDVERILGQYRSSDHGENETAIWARKIGIPLIEGFKSFWQSDYTDSAETLHANRFIVNAFGGSHAQRDIIDWTMTEAATRSGQADRARAFANERIALKPHSPLNGRFLKRIGQNESVSNRAA